MTLDCEVVRTRSGAVAMRDRLTGEVMHPVVGPRVESQKLYVEAARLPERLQDRGSGPLRLLDVGLGAGSNAIEALEAAQSLGESARPLEIVSFDRSLAALTEALRPDHAAHFGLDGSVGEAARELVQHGSFRGARTSWRLSLGSLPATLEAEAAESADVVFWDPFSPLQNPELWTVAAFQALHRLCRSGATFFTYSAATATRSALLLAGFAVGEGDITGFGKRTTQAALHAKDLSAPLGKRWLERLARSSAPFPSDAPPDALACIAACAQFVEP
ncbi:MAG: MnmC family methyltransferase [Polyangiaceae bacterium]